MATKYKNYFFLFLLLCLFAPLIQQFTHAYQERPLIGLTKDSINALPDFSFSKWWEGKYQENTNEWGNKYFGFRTDFVRINNQLNFALFRKSNLENGLEVGKDDYLFLKPYYDAYTGADAVKKEEIYAKFKQIKLIQDSLEAKGKTFFFMITPNKVDFFPEYLPKKVISTQNVEPNYKNVLQICGELGIHVFDVNAYFLAKKGKTPYPLFPKNGIHWSSYGETLVLDSMVHYLELNRKIDMPDIKYAFSMSEDNSDDDLQDAMNLLYPLKTYALSVPKLTIEATGKQKLKVLLVGDSFSWMLLKLNNINQVFGKLEVWHYYQQKYITYNNEEKINKKDLKKEVNDNEVVILESNPINLPRLGWGFIEDMNGLFSGLSYPLTIIKNVEDEIRKSPDWFEQVKKQAAAANISLETCLRNNAIYFLDQQNK
jgi:hypothetical protein